MQSYPLREAECSFWGWGGKQNLDLEANSNDRLQAVVLRLVALAVSGSG